MLKFNENMRERKIKEILTFLHRSKGLESAVRYSASLRNGNNTVAAHSWRLGLMALVIGTECKVRIDIHRAMTLALVHDLAEAKTGDIDAVELIDGGKGAMDNKISSEDKAMREMTDDLEFGDWIYSIWREYEDQQTVEAKFVKALDKIEGFLHIAEAGVEAYTPKEFHAEYATAAVEAFDEATRHFPELKDLLDAVKVDLHAQFEKVGVAWVDTGH